MIYLYQLLFIAFSLLFGDSARATKWLFRHLLERVIHIGGACQSTGQCCRSIDLFYRERPITTVRDWHAFLDDFPTLQHFQPTVFNGRIQSFDCHHLSANNRCLDYGNRPSLCRDYPRSFVLSHGTLHPGCGYRIDILDQHYQSLFPSIQSRIDSFLNLT